jgi:hypothetical protein
MTRLASFALAMAIITAALLRRAPVAVPMRSPGGKGGLVMGMEVRQ